MVHMEAQLANFFALRAQKMALELIHEDYEQGTNQLEDIVGGRGIPIKVSCLISHLEYLANGIQAL